ncbi:MAG: hypothetical protein ACI89L_002751 [Phycisphaerales bacterium]|jgi:hypothetical protein
MTKSRAAALAIALASASASAQQQASVSLSHDDLDGIIAIGDTVTWSLWVGFSGFDPGWVVGLGDLTITGDNSLGTASDMSYEFFNGGAFFGTSNGAGLSEIRFGNAPFCVDTLCTPARDDNPLLIGSFTFTAASQGTLNYALAEGTASWGFVEMQLDQFTRVAFDENQTTLNVSSLTILPSPGAFAGLALGGLLATRRRRT